MAELPLPATIEAIFAKYAEAPQRFRAHLAPHRSAVNAIAACGFSFVGRHAQRFPGASCACSRPATVKRRA